MYLKIAAARLQAIKKPPSSPPLFWFKSPKESFLTPLVIFDLFLSCSLSVILLSNDDNLKRDLGRINILICPPFLKIQTR